VPTRRGVLIGASALALAGTAHAKPGPVALFKNPGCGCCDGYADYLRGHGFTVEVTETPELSEISRKAGIPADFQGCHTAFHGSYVVEGHVPIEAVNKLLAERPNIVGLSLPGMPEGSPGMGGKKGAPFTILAIGPDGKSSIFSTL
jgi:hypothetical protein